MSHLEAVFFHYLDFGVIWHLFYHIPLLKAIKSSPLPDDKRRALDLLCCSHIRRACGMEICSGSHVPIMKMGEAMESKQLLFLNILIPSFLKSNNILVKQTKPMVNSDSGWRVTVSQGMSHTTSAQNHALHGLDIRLHVM